MAVMLRALLIGLLAGQMAHAQFPPEPKGLTLLKSKFHENVTISFKEPGICETTPGVRSYAGYVHLPPGALDNETQNYPINTFFWFFEARKAPENAPLTIWLNGGPGASSLMGLLEENGPCLINADSKTTRLNPWSWNNEVNMLYLDQPTQVGFSYDVATNCTYEAISEDGDIGFLARPADFSGGEVPEVNATYRVGTFGSQDGNSTVNSTAHAAHALWHFAQTWFFEFPGYKPLDNRVSLWAESYGGHYGPAFMRFFQEQNEKIANGSSAEQGAQYIHLDTLGIVNGLVDMVVQGEAYIKYPYNNTYGIQVFNESLYNQLMHDWHKPDGCKVQAKKCQDALRDQEPMSLTALRTDSQLRRDVDGACTEYADRCGMGGAEAYNNLTEGGRGWFDIGHPRADPFPEPHLLGYLLEESVLGALGVPVNYTPHSSLVAQGFFATHDVVHGGYLDAIAYLLDSGVKVHMMYGDRDMACNWIGGELASLAVPYGQAGKFAEAGYAPLLTPDGVSGMTRQYGNFSFSRVYQSGHEVPSYQPAAAYEIFMRATFNRDIATGLIPVTDSMTTLGPSDTWFIKNEPPEMPTPRCYVLKPDSCVPEIWEKVVAGNVTIKDYFVVEGSEKEEIEEMGEL